jgi:hypothetical protein
LPIASWSFDIQAIADRWTYWDEHGNPWPRALPGECHAASPLEEIEADGALGSRDRVETSVAAVPARRLQLSEPPAFEIAVAQWPIEV